jgi:hypothetical protein
VCRVFIHVVSTCSLVMVPASICRNNPEKRGRRMSAGKHQWKEAKEWQRRCMREGPGEGQGGQGMMKNDPGR